MLPGLESPFPLFVTTIFVCLPLFWKPVIVIVRSGFGAVVVVVVLVVVVEVVVGVVVVVVVVVGVIQVERIACQLQPAVVHADWLEHAPQLLIAHVGEAVVVVLEVEVVVVVPPAAVVVVPPAVVVVPPAVVVVVLELVVVVGGAEQEEAVEFHMHVTPVHADWLEQVPQLLRWQVGEVVVVVEAVDVVDEVVPPAVVVVLPPGGSVQTLFRQYPLSHSLCSLQASPSAFFPSGIVVLPVSVVCPEVVAVAFVVVVFLVVLVSAGFSTETCPEAAFFIAQITCELSASIQTVTSVSTSFELNKTFL